MDEAFNRYGHPQLRSLPDKCESCGGSGLYWPQDDSINSEPCPVCNGPRTTPRKRTISGSLRDVPALRRSNDLAREAARQRRWEARHEILRD